MFTNKLYTIAYKDITIIHVLYEGCSTMLKISPKAQHQLLFKTVWQMDQCLSARFSLLLNTNVAANLKLDYHANSNTYLVKSADNGKLVKQGELATILAYLDGLEDGLLCSSI